MVRSSRSTRRSAASVCAKASASRSASTSKSSGNEGAPCSRACCRAGNAPFNRRSICWMPWRAASMFLMSTTCCVCVSSRLSVGGYKELAPILFGGGRPPSRAHVGRSCYSIFVIGPRLSSVTRCRQRVEDLSFVCLTNLAQLPPCDNCPGLSHTPQHST